MVGRPSIIAKKFYFINLYGGEVWINDIDIIISEDEYWIYRLEIEHGEWCRQRQILIIREFNTLRDKCEEELQEHINDGKERYKRGLD